MEKLRHITEIGKDLASLLLEGVRVRNLEARVPSDIRSFPVHAFKACPGQVPSMLAGTEDGTVLTEQPGWSSQFQVVVG